MWKRIRLQLVAVTSAFGGLRSMFGHQRKGLASTRAVPNRRRTRAGRQLAVPDNRPGVRDYPDTIRQTRQMSTLIGATEHAEGSMRVPSG